MKTQVFFRRAETLEDIVFEGRNKSYGAFEMNQKRGKYLIIAFLIAFTGISTAIAVPFLKSMNKRININLPEEHVIDVSNVGNYKPTPPPPPPSTEIEGLDKKLEYKIPVVVDKSDDSTFAFDYNILEQAATSDNEPVDSLIAYVDNPIDKQVIVESDPPMPCPQEYATFMGGDLNTFREWVSDNIKYPEEAINERIFGKVIIQFCVNTKGNVVDMEFLRNLDPLLDKETLRVISASPAWVPAKQGGRPVKQLFVIPINFDLRYSE